MAVSGNHILSILDLISKLVFSYFLFEKLRFFLCSPWYIIPFIFPLSISVQSINYYSSSLHLSDRASYVAVVSFFVVGNIFSHKPKFTCHAIMGLIHRIFIRDYKLATLLDLSLGIKKESFVFYFPWRKNCFYKNCTHLHIGFFAIWTWQQDEVFRNTWSENKLHSVHKSCINIWAAVSWYNVVEERQQGLIVIYKNFFITNYTSWLIKHAFSSKRNNGVPKTSRCISQSSLITLTAYYLLFVRLW